MLGRLLAMLGRPRNLFRRMSADPGPAAVQHWDDRAAAAGEFPASEWDRYPATGPDDARQIVAGLAPGERRMVFGQARWFGPGDGAVFVRKARAANP